MKKLVRIFIVIIFLISVLYIYFLNATIGAAVENKNNSKKIEALNQENQILESQYFNLLEEVDIEYAHQLGFVDQSQKTDYVFLQTDFALR